MIDGRAYSYPIVANGSSTEEDGAVHQVSPSWILTFVSWEFRDTLRTLHLDNATQLNTSTNLNTVRSPMVIRNDCINLTVTSNKSSYTPNMAATLVQTDVNYLTAIAPGDFVFVNMLNWEADAERVAKQAENLAPINGINDGFKGLFKVQSVRRTVVATPDGKKSVRFNITGLAFTEFNNCIYFDPFVVLQNPAELEFMKGFQESWKNLIDSTGTKPVQKIIRILSETFIGRGVKATVSNSNSINPQNNTFFMPASIGQLLNISGVTAAKDIYNFILGIQNYNVIGAIDVYAGLTPSGLINTVGRTWEGPAAYNCPGHALLKTEYWQEVKVWDILNQYTNSPINEFFTCFRIDPAKNNIVPTVVFRQMPFTTEDFFLDNPSVNSNTKVTRFMTLPRWEIDSAMVLNEDLGRDEALRINFVQMFGKVLQGTKEGDDFTAESQRGNFVYEINDIRRSGMKTAIRTSSFDLFSENSSTAYNSVTWAKIYADQLIGGHLKLSGHLLCAGIVDPIPVGDNVQYNDVV